MGGPPLSQSKYNMADGRHLENRYDVDVDLDLVDLRAQADASMPASNNNVNYTI